MALEDWVYELNLDKDGRITSFSGPIYGEQDRTIQPAGQELALIPAGFFKVVCFINKYTDSLDVRAFVIYQDEAALRDKRGRRRYNNQTYQTTVSEIEQLTGLRFDDAVYQANPLIYSEEGGASAEPALNVSEPENLEVSNSDEIIAADDSRPILCDDDIAVYVAAAMANPEGEDEGNEWLSLINLGSVEYNISNWYLLDNSKEKLQLGSVLDDEQCQLAPGESRVIKPLSPLKLSNKKDVIKLFTGDDQRVDWVNYRKHMVAVGEPIIFLSPRDTLS